MLSKKYFFFLFLYLVNLIYGQSIHQHIEKFLTQGRYIEYGTLVDLSDSIQRTIKFSQTQITININNDHRPLEAKYKEDIKKIADLQKYIEELEETKFIFILDNVSVDEEFPSKPIKERIDKEKYPWIFFIIIQNNKIIIRYTQKGVPLHEERFNINISNQDIKEEQIKQLFDVFIVNENRQCTYNKNYNCRRSALYNRFGNNVVYNASKKEYNFKEESAEYCEIHRYECKRCNNRNKIKDSLCQDCSNCINNSFKNYNIAYLLEYYVEKKNQKCQICYKMAALYDEDGKNVVQNEHTNETNFFARSAKYCHFHRFKCRNCSYNGRVNTQTSYCENCQRHNTPETQSRTEKNADACSSKECYKPKAYGKSYCDDHSCPIQNCYKPKQSNKSYCDDHSCPIQNCYKPKQSNKSYCDDHSCPNCYKPKQSNKSYCDDHSCPIQNCYKPKQSNKSYCDYHSCPVQNCYKPKQSNKSYCDDHSCTIQNCYSRKRSNNYCHIHGCPICVNSKDTTKRYCNTHSCPVQNCYKPKAYGKSYCDDHSCPIQNCYKPKAYGKSYCDDHSCPIQNCYKPKQSNKSYCDDHSCPIQNCYKPKQSNKSYKSYCNEHSCPLCDNSKDTRKSYCNEHSCPLCDNSKDTRKSYCNEHSCPLILCDNSKDTRKKYCNAHLCSFPGGCDQPRLENESYCIDHKCPFCNKIVVQRSTDDVRLSCQNHLYRCSHFGECTERSGKQSYYCPQHSCIIKLADMKKIHTIHTHIGFCKVDERLENLYVIDGDEKGQYSIEADSLRKSGEYIPEQYKQRRTPKEQSIQSLGDAVTIFYDQEGIYLGDRNTKIHSWKQLPLLHKTSHSWLVAWVKGKNGFVAWIEGKEKIKYIAWSQDNKSKEEKVLYEITTDIGKITSFHLPYDIKPGKNPFIFYYISTNEKIFSKGSFYLQYNWE